MDDPWDAVVGQPRAVEALRRAARQPVHAYLLVGPSGSGVEAAARAFAAELLGGGDDVAERVVRGRHPDVVEFAPTATSYSVKDDIRPRVLPAATMSPVEADRRVLVLWEAERLHGNQDEPQHALLKTLEEPPPRTFLLLVCSRPDDLLETVRSRCQRIDFVALDDETVRAALVESGVDTDRAELAARLAGGNLDRASRLAGSRSELHRTFADVATELDGTGAAVVRATQALVAAVDRDLEALRADHEREEAELEEEIERGAYPDRTAQAMRRRLAETQKRRDRKDRQDALLEGITAIESVYRDALAGGALARNVDRVPIRARPRAAAAALDACRDARDALIEFNPNEVLLLERLLASLPSAAPGAVAAAG